MLRERESLGFIVVLSISGTQQSRIRIESTNGAKITGSAQKILEEGALIFWFHSHDARYEERASVHVGKGSQDDFNDANIWLDPEIEVARPGRTLKRHALGHPLKVILDTFAPGKWTGNKTMRNFFNTMYRACVYTVDC